MQVSREPQPLQGLPATSCAVVLALMLLVGASAAVAEDADTRVFEFHYQTSIGPIEAGSGPVHVFIPLAVQNEQQRVLGEDIAASIPGVIEIESRYGNRFWHGVLEPSTVMRCPSRS